MARLRISADHLPPMAREWVRLIVPLSGRIARAVVVDLKNVGAAAALVDRNLRPAARLES